MRWIASVCWLCLMLIPSTATAVDSVYLTTNDVDVRGKKVSFVIEGGYYAGEEEKVLSVRLLLFDKHDRKIDSIKGQLNKQEKTFSINAAGKNVKSYQVIFKSKDRTYKRNKVTAYSKSQVFQVD